MNTAKSTLDELKRKLDAAGINTTTLRTLRDVAIEGYDDFASIQETDVEKSHPIYTLTSTREDVYYLWERLRAVIDQTGYYPVILGDKDHVGQHWEIRENAKSPHEYVQKAKECDASAWLEEEWESIFAFDEHFNEEKSFGNWDETVTPLVEFDIFKLIYKPNLIQYIGLVNTTITWEVPAYLPYGNWNENPPPDKHVCVQRYWYNHYKAELVVMTHATLIFRVASPVSSRDAALELAREHMAYSTDVVFQGYGTLKALASNLLNSNYWWFWWD
jgi:hypothetical protein